MILVPTFNIPRICIFAIISAVNRSVTVQSTTNVTVCKYGYFSNDFGVFKETDNKLKRAQSLNMRLTHSCKNIHFCKQDYL